jgi:putative selenate reductase molybdopterin-binding subunit
VLSNTGAYGNHAGPVLFHSVGECIGVYNCPNKKVDGVAAYTNTVPAGAFRGYGLPQTLIAVEAAIDELARQLGISPFEMRRRNVVKPGDPMLSPPESEYHDVLYGSYGLDQCLDLVERAMAADAPKPRALRGLADRRRHRADHDRHRAAGRPFRRLQHSRCARTAASTSRSAPPNSATAPAPCIARSPRPRWRPRSIASVCWQSDTAHGGHDTGAYGSAGIFVAGRATQAAAEALAAPTEAIRGVIAGREPGRVFARQPRHGLRRTPHALCPARRVRATRSARCSAPAAIRRARRARSPSTCRAFASP